MGAIEDFRKVLQDFLAPELRAVNARLDAMEKVMEAQHREVLARLDGLERYFQLDKRVDRLEGREPHA